MERFDAVIRGSLGRPFEAQARLVRESYEELFGDLRGTGADEPLREGDLRLRYRAAASAAFYTFDASYVEEMTALLGLLQGRDLATETEIARMHRTLIAVRDLEAARRLASQYPSVSLEEIPAVAGPQTIAVSPHRVWRVPAERAELAAESLDLAEDATILVVSHPRCHFSRDAVAAIEGDPVLGPIFGAHAVWLAPPSGRLDLDLVRQWNRDHPSSQMALAVKHGDWPEVQVWSTPFFYFLRSGVLVTSVEGWPAGGRKEEILAALRSLGIPSESRSKESKRLD